MVICPKCGKELEDGSKFCENCGTSIPEQKAQAAVQEPVKEPVQAQSAGYVFCPGCGKKLPAGTGFCDSCGASLGAAAQQAGASNTASKQAGTSAAGGNPVKNLLAGMNKKVLAAGLAAAGILLVALVCVGIFSAAGKRGGAQPECALYVKDEEILFSNLNSKEPLQVTEHLIKGDADNYDFVDIDELLSYYTTISADGKYLFFPDKGDGRSSFYRDGSGPTIYYSRISKLGKEAVKIDSDIYEYAVSDDAAYVTYLKNGTLYSYNMKKDDKEKISGDVTEFYVSDDGKQVYYIDDDETLYLWTMGKGKEKIDSGISYVSTHFLYYYFNERPICYISDDFKTIYYKKDGNLYRSSVGKEREKIASDVFRVIRVFDSGCIYYFKEMELSREMFFEDDSEAGDYSSPMFPSDDITKLFGMFCYFDGRKETEIGVGVINSYQAASDAEALAFALLDPEDFDRVTLSDIYANGSSLDALNERLPEEMILSLALKDKVIPLDIEGEDMYDWQISPDGSRILYLDDYNDEKYEGDLYLVTVKGNKLSDAEQVASDAYGSGWGFAGDSYVYYADVDTRDRTGEFYVDGKLVADDVYLSGRTSASGVYYFYSDYDYEKERGTLQYYAGGKAVAIAEDVHDYYVIGEKEVLVLNDYNLNRYEGDLYLYDRKKLKAIDEDVVCIVKPSLSY
ncbi:MAG: zinc-ribbon domain-containing protein [Blautia sp.]|nr:zinc-ribbon domain-containing protein [Blautia sp.]